MKIFSIILTFLFSINSYSQNTEIQFFTSKYSTKTFPKIAIYGDIISFEKLGLYVYRLKPYSNPVTILSQVKAEGFKDAFIVPSSDSSSITLEPIIPQTLYKPKTKTKYKSSKIKYSSSSGCSTTRCRGQTQKGKRCKRKTKNCSGRCWQH